ncbi:MAG: hypothetical protein KDC92_06720 [Bacteroidetes bacterium]|nr:hypothetical protein [Bacteroidota bacterium]
MRFLTLLAILLFWNTLSAKIHINTIWSNSESGVVDEYSWSNSIVDNNNNVITIANKINGSDFDILVKSYDQNGSLNWTYTYDSGNGARDRALKVLVDNNDNYYVVGSSEDLTSGHDVLIFKLSSSGALQWDEFWNGSENRDDLPTDAEITSSGDVLVTGISNHSSPEHLNGASDADIFALKCLSTGSINWDKELDLDGYDDISVGCTFDGSYLYVGAHSTFSSTINKITILKIDEIYGGLETTIQESSVSKDICSDIIAKNGSVYVIGRTGISKNASIIKYSASLIKQWQTDINPNNHGALCRNLYVSTSGEVYVNIEFTGHSGQGNGRTAKINSDGTVDWNLDFEAYEVDDVLKAKSLNFNNNKLIAIYDEKNPNSKDKTGAFIIDVSGEVERYIELENGAFAETNDIDFISNNLVFTTVVEETIGSGRKSIVTLKEYYEFDFTIETDVN